MQQGEKHEVTSTTYEDVEFGDPILMALDYPRCGEQWAMEEGESAPYCRCPLCGGNNVIYGGNWWGTTVCCMEEDKNNHLEHFIVEKLTTTGETHEQICAAIRGLGCTGVKLPDYISHIAKLVEKYGQTSYRRYLAKTMDSILRNKAAAVVAKGTE